MRSVRRSRPRVVLLAEDDPGDQELTRRALEAEPTPPDLRIVEDGEEALDYLFRRGDYADAASAPLPDVVMLDLNMPRVGGREVLEAVRSSSGLRRVPIVVVTTSDEERDVACAYDLGCSSFLEKPTEGAAFMAAVRALHRYWLELVTLPAPRPELR